MRNGSRMMHEVTPANSGATDELACVRAENEALRAELARRARDEAELRLLARLPAENPNPVLRLDMAGTVLYANEAGDRLLRD